MDIQHDVDDQRYSLIVNDEQNDNAVVLRYQRPDEHSINFTSTFTPVNLRGQGLARKLVEYALDEAEQQGLRIEASCWYVAKLLKERQAKTSANKNPM